MTNKAMEKSLDKALPGRSSKSSKNEWLKELGLEDEDDISNSCDNSASEDDEEKVSIAEYHALKRLLQKENGLKEKAVVQYRESQKKSDEFETQLAKIKQNSKTQLNILKGSLKTQLKEKDDLVATLRDAIKESTDSNGDSAIAVLKLTQSVEELTKEKAALNDELSKMKVAVDNAVVEKSMETKHLKRQIEELETQAKEVVLVTEGSQQSKNISEIQSQLDKFRQQCEKAEKQIKELDDNLSHTSHEYEAVKLNLSVRDEELKREKGFSKSLEEENNELKAAVLSLEAREKQLRENDQAKRELEEENTRYKECEKELQSKVEMLQKECTHLADEVLPILKSKNRKLENSVETLSQELKISKEALEQELDLRESKEGELAEATGAYSKALEDAERVTVEFNDLRSKHKSEIEEMEKEKSSINEKLETLFSDMKNLKEKHHEELQSVEERASKAISTAAEKSAKLEEVEATVNSLKIELETKESNFEKKRIETKERTAELEEKLTMVEEAASKQKEEYLNVEEEYQCQIKEYSGMLEQANEDLKKTMFSHETALNALELEKNSTLAEYKEYQQASMEEISLLKEQVITFKSECESSKTELLQAQQNSESDLERKNKDISELEEKVSELANNINLKDQEYESLKAENESQLHVLNSQLETMECDSKKVKEELEIKTYEQEQMLKDNLEKVEQFRTQISSLEAELKKEKYENLTKQEELNQKDRDICKMADQVSSVEEEAKEATLAKETAEQQIDFLKESLNQTTEELGTENEKLSLEKCDLEQELDNIRKELKAVNHSAALESAEKVKRIEELQNQFDVSKNESNGTIMTLQAENKSYVQQITSLKNEINILTVETIPQLEAKLNESQKSHGLLLQEKSSLQQRIEALEDHEIPEMETKLRQHLSQVEALQKQKEGLEAVAVKNEEEKDFLREANLQLDEANKKIEELELELVRKEHEFAKQLSDEKNILEDNLSKVSKKANGEIERMKENFQKVLGALSVMRAGVKELKENSISDIKNLSSEMHISLGQQISNVSLKIRDSINEQNDLNKDLVSKYKKEMILRKKYFNELVSLKGNIRVMCRVRPMIKQDKDSRNVVGFDRLDQGIINVESRGTIKGLELDQVFKPSSTQEEVFNEVRDLITSAIDGFNVCIFAYGQTGSGKTFTMEGSPENPGVNVRGLHELFRVIQERKPEWNYNLCVSVLEIYNESIRDLLCSNKSPKKLEIKQTRNGVEVPGIEQTQVECVEDIQKTFEIAHKNRRTAETSMNERSSRSHALMIVNIMGVNETTGAKSTGKLNLIDLAGSERVSKSEATGDRLKEAQNINKSLSALGDVIHALASKNSHVPYRNSKLTYMLQDSLSGDSKTLMICQVGPAEYNVGETMCTLNFAARVRSVELGPPKKNSADGEVSRLQGRIKELEKELARRA